MPDITMCKGEGCHLKAKCLRYTSEPDELGQSYFLHEPVTPNGTCEYFWSSLWGLIPLLRAKGR